MENPVLDKIRILLAEPQATARDYLFKQLEGAGLLGDISEVDSITKLQKNLEEHRFDLCLVGPGFIDADQLSIISTIANDKRHEHCAIVPIAQRQDNELLIAYVRAGAHGMLLQPINAKSFFEVVRTAMKKAEAARVEPDTAPEQINSLPWILESFADRLEQVAERLKSAELQGVRVEATAKSVKEVLLSTIAVSGDVDEKAVERIVQTLLKQKR